MPALHHIGVLAGASLDVVRRRPAPARSKPRRRPTTSPQEIAIGGGRHAEHRRRRRDPRPRRGRDARRRGHARRLARQHGRNRRAERQAERHRQLLAGGGRHARARSAQRERRRLSRRRRDRSISPARCASPRPTRPASAAAPLVLAATSKPEGAFAKTLAPISAERGWVPAYGATGVSLALGAPSAGGDAPASLTAPVSATGRARRGRAHDLPPGDVEGRAHAGLSMAPRRQADRRRHEGALSRRSRRPRPQAVLPRDRDLGGAETRPPPAAGARGSRLGLRIGGVSAGAGGALSANVWCARSERRCSGSLQRARRRSCRRARPFRAQRRRVESSA